MKLVRTSDYQLVAACGLEVIPNNPSLNAAKK